MRSFAVLLALALLAPIAVACGGDDATTYALGIRFKPDVYAVGDEEAVEEYVREQGSDFRYIVEDSLPPILSVSVDIAREGYCPTLEAELRSRAYVARVDCQEDADPVGPVE